MNTAFPIDALHVAAYKVPTDSPESDGTLKWDHTTMVVVRAAAAGHEGLGWTYAPRAAAPLVEDILRDAVVGRDALAIEDAWQHMVQHLRNAGAVGAGMMAVSVVDIALWDLKGKLLGRSIADLLGPVRDAVELYGSGGFTSYSDERLREQLGAWAQHGLRHVKMKVGRDPAADPDRVAAARQAIGEHVQLFVDANGAYSRKQALAMAEIFREESGVAWFEEPRPSDDLPGLRLLRDRAPAGMDIAAGEYGDTPLYFRRMLEAGAVDCLQADATRCGGFTGFLKASALCEAFNVPLSAHCAPQLHAHVGCAAAPLRHVEYFHDHVRIANLLLDGALPAIDGRLTPDRSRPGHGMSLKTNDAAPYRV